MCSDLPISVFFESPSPPDTCNPITYILLNFGWLRGGDQLPFVKLMKPEKQFRLFIKPGADAGENRRNMFAHLGPSPGNCTTTRASSVTGISRLFCRQMHHAFRKTSLSSTVTQEHSWAGKANGETPPFARCLLRPPAASKMVSSLCTLFHADQYWR